MTQANKILLVDDEADILEFLSYNLKKESYEVRTASDGKEAISIAKTFNPDLILLDIMMPEMDGVEVCKTLRSLDQFKHTIIAFLTARSESFTQIAALDSGGDDFLNKPIKTEVLKSKIKALLRRSISPKSTSENVTLGPLMVNFDNYTVSINGNPINLAKKEFELLSLLISKPDKVFKRQEILSKIWGKEVIVGDRTIDVHIRKLREKIGAKYIQTQKGVGYRFTI